MLKIISQKAVEQTIEPTDVITVVEEEEIIIADGAIAVNASAPDTHDQPNQPVESKESNDDKPLSPDQVQELLDIVDKSEKEAGAKAKAKIYDNATATRCFICYCSNFLSVL